MTNPQDESASQESIDDPKESKPTKPTVWIQEIEFRNGLRTNLEPGEILVVVGPNNSGKSLLLRDLFSALQRGKKAHPLTISGLRTVKEGTEKQVADWVSSFPKRNSNHHALPFAGPQNPVDLSSQWQSSDQRGFQTLTPFVAQHLSTEGRLSAASPTESLNARTDHAQHALHKLYDEEELEMEISELVSSTFKFDLVVNRSAGNQVLLHVGERPKPKAGEDRLSKSFRDAVHLLPPLHEQGDGVRAFVGVVVSVLVKDTDILLVDEPEAFLHPPQAHALGRFLAERTPLSKQLIVATHSSDLLRGLIDQPNSRVRVLRIERDGQSNRTTELKPAQVRRVWSDPLLRFSKVLDGLFHQGAVVCEADGDCRFYSAISDVLEDREIPRDISWLYAAGKSRIATIVESLRAVRVPVRAVLDFDVLSSEHDLKRIVEVMGGDWAEFESDFRIVKAAVEQKRPELKLVDVKSSIGATLSSVASDTIPSEKLAELRDILKRSSAWGEAKKVGKSFVPNGEQSAAFNRLNDGLRAIGIFIVEVGELEGFCKSVASHGPVWVAQVLERDIKSDPELREAREFVQRLLSGWI